MIALALLAAAQVSPPAIPVPAPAAILPMLPQRSAAPPADLVRLPELPYKRRFRPADALSDFVRVEVDSGRCAAPRMADATRQVLRVELAVYVTQAGTIRRILPRAIGCATVEQYASGIVSQVARGNIDLAATPGNQWFRTAMVFSWPR